MCGICGFFGDGAAISDDTLERMNSTLVRRGPDDRGAFREPGVGLAMRRLSIIDLEGGRQPIHNEDATVWVICNGEIYNYRELRRELEGRGHTFLTHSDCEVIIPLYRELGAGLVDRLNGMFGFALWDAEKRRLLVGRDRLGIKPIYTWSDGRHFAFASEAKALFALGDVRPALDEEATEDHAEDEEGHGRAMVEIDRDLRAARRRLAAALHAEPVGTLGDIDAAGLEAPRHGA